MNVPFLDLSAQYHTIRSEIDSVISEVLSSAAFVKGPHVAAFERAFSDYIGTSHCIGCGNGTDALEMAIAAFKFPPGSEIIVPANTFAATAEAVVRTGHTPVFVDTAEDYTPDTKHLESLVTEQTVAVIPVHIFGQPADMWPIQKTAAKHGLKIIEDAAQAHGAAYRNTMVGTLGDAATFSFYPGKNLGAYGDAGTVVTNDARIARRIRAFSDHGRERKQRHDFVGRNSRLDGLQAAVLSVKLSHLDEWNSKRRQCAHVYLEQLAGIGDIITPPVSEDRIHVWHVFAIRTDHRDELQHYLRNHGVQTGIHYSRSLPQQPSFITFAADREYRANRFSQQLLSLPVGDHLSREQILYVCKTVREFFSS